ncbi:MAG: oligosaccharide flippase family protein, partial [Paracoccaceae bacterium]
WRPGLATSARQMMTAARFGLHVIGMRLGELTAGQVPTVAIGATLGPEATGLYAVAWKLIETLSFLLVTPIRQASQSAFAALMRQGEGAGDLLQDISRLSSAIAVPFFCGLALLSGPMVALVFGAGWESAAPVLAVLSAIGIYLCLARVQVSFCLAAGAPGPVALVLWVTAGLIAALILFAAGGGISLVAAAVTLAYGLTWPLLILTTSRLAGLGLLPFVEGILMPLVGSGLMAAALWPLILFLRDQSPVIQVALPALAGMGLYLGFALITMRDRIALFRRYVRAAA